MPALAILAAASSAALAGEPGLNPQAQYLTHLRDCTPFAAKLSERPGSPPVQVVIQSKGPDACLVLLIVPGKPPVNCPLRKPIMDRLTAPARMTRAQAGRLDQAEDIKLLVEECTRRP